MDNEQNDPPPALTLEAFEQVVVADLERLKADEEHKTAVRDKVDIICILIGLALTALLIWAKLDNWAPESGIIPIAGVTVRRALGI